jgi:hypothetical protein
MKRQLSSYASLGLALMFFLFFAGCKKSDNTSGKTTANGSSSTSSSTSSSSSKSSSSNRFVGTWNQAAHSDTSYSIVIKDDGTYTIKSTSSEGPSVSGSYTASGDSLTLKDPEGKGDDATATITDDGRLKIESRDGSEYFVRD